MNEIEGKTVATVGIGKKHPKFAKFHAGHEFVISETKKLDADVKIVMLTDDYKISKYIRTGKIYKSPETVDINYMRKWLSDKDIDIFYYLSVNDFINNWMLYDNRDGLLNWIKEVKAEEGYSIGDIYDAWFCVIHMIEKHKLMNRKYWVSSTKEEEMRSTMKHFCDNYTNITTIQLPPISENGVILSSTGK